MRIILALLLAVFCMSSGVATDRTAYLTGLAGVPIQVFDLQAADVSQNFREFMSSVPMTNDRPVPTALVDDTVATLSFIKSGTALDEPAYFVAAYIQKTPLVAAPLLDRIRYQRRYGEEVFPQQVCPVFISRANADASRLLSTAVNLPASYFESIAGDAEGFDRLFSLTEASHCGFIARELVQPTVLPANLDRKQVRTILEALGDFEATAVFRSTTHRTAIADEADVLLAARLLAMFLLDRENAYTSIPGLVHEYERIGIDASHRQFERIADSVRLARRTVRQALQAEGALKKNLPLDAVRSALLAAQSRQQLQVDDGLATSLIDAFLPAMQLIEGDLNSRVFPPARTANGVATRQRARLVTLVGTGSI